MVPVKIQRLHYSDLRLDPSPHMPGENTRTDSSEVVWALSRTTHRLPPGLLHPLGPFLEDPGLPSPFPPRLETSLPTPPEPPEPPEFLPSPLTLPPPFSLPPFLPSSSNLFGHFPPPSLVRPWGWVLGPRHDSRPSTVTGPWCEHLVGSSPVHPPFLDRSVPHIPFQ